MGQVDEPFRYWCISCPAEVRYTGSVDPPYWVHADTGQAHCPAGSGVALPRRQGGGQVRRVLDRG